MEDVASSPANKSPSPAKKPVPAKDPAKEAAGQMNTHIAGEWLHLLLLIVKCQ